MNKKEFTELTDLISALFPKDDIKFSKASAEAWYEALQDLDFEYARKGVMKYAQKNQWAPTIADIRKYTPAKPLLSEEAIARIIAAHQGPDEW